MGLGEQRKLVLIPLGKGQGDKAEVLDYQHDKDAIVIFYIIIHRRC